VAADVVFKALRHVWTSLEPLNAPMAVMGGLALAAWGHVRATRDVDLLLAISDDDLTALLETLTSAGVRPKHKSGPPPLGSVQILQMLYEPPGAYLDLQVDLLLAQSDYHRQALARSVLTSFPAADLNVYVLACEDLIVHKLLAGRLIDLADSATLLRTNRATLDLPYFLGCAAELSLETGFTQIWEEAFPGEAIPSIDAGG
jgi:hypothetical protein